jgi:hypothetical protein
MGEIKMDSELIIETIIEALKHMDSPRFFKTERGFHGRFACTLHEIFDAKKIFQDDTIIEEEYQKRIVPHGTRLRPDLIVHVPVESSHSSSRTEKNFVVFAFKRQANEDRVKQDFKKPNELFENLKYQLGIFININGRSEIFLNKYSGLFKNRIHEFCITQTNDKLDILHAYFQNDKVITENVE